MKNSKETTYNDGLADIEQLKAKGHKVLKLNDWQFRINGMLDIWPSTSKFHMLKSNKRGNYRNLVEWIESMTSYKAESRGEETRVAVPNQEAQIERAEAILKEHEEACQECLSRSNKCDIAPQVKAHIKRLKDGIINQKIPYNKVMTQHKDKYRKSEYKAF